MSNNFSNNLDCSLLTDLLRPVLRGCEPVRPSSDLHGKDHRGLQRQEAS